MSEDAIHVEVVYPHPIERVWQALTNPVALGDWLMPNDFEPRLGHRFTFRTEPQPQQGFSGIVECEVVELTPPTRVAYTWRGGSGVLDTLVTFTLASEGSGTRLHLDHTGFAGGGHAGLTVRDILASGWNSKILRTRLPALLDTLAADQERVE